MTTGQGLCRGLDASDLSYAGQPPAPSRRHQRRHQRPLSVNELRLVHEVKTSGSVTSPDVAETLRLIPATAKNVLGRLVKLGILEAREVGRSRQFPLTARFYDLAQDRAAYVRVKGADPLQQERMIVRLRQRLRINKSQPGRTTLPDDSNQERSTSKRLPLTGDWSCGGTSRGPLRPRRPADA